MCATRYTIDSVQNGTQSRPGRLEGQTISSYCLESTPDYLAVYSIAHSLYLLSNRGLRFTEKWYLFNGELALFCVVTSYIRVLIRTNVLLKSTESLSRG
jgi:hypothetical protein